MVERIHSGLIDHVLRRGRRCDQHGQKRSNAEKSGLGHLASPYHRPTNTWAVGEQERHFDDNIPGKDRLANHASAILM